MNTEIVKTENKALVQSFDLSKELPNLEDAKVLPMDLSSEYWTPETPGESKLCFFQEIKLSTYTDTNTGETIDLPCVILLEQKDKVLKTIRNGSKRLVASIEDAITQGKVAQGSPLKIEFLGKEKNSTNANKSDRWSIKPLLIQ
ncbi:hypothetical protein BWK60_07680 [Flavobacterium covae]|uniref:hypothetical protein n=1 Tax=Flavobacterium covae TaxID=2906076 RepID=UPI000B4DE640|nr:hypothetical protein [Flavobacterium covae]OWP86652.1 hypothetical protein BWK60_07680 [Flavobacterium covae]